MGCGSSKSSDTKPLWDECSKVDASVLVVEDLIARGANVNYKNKFRVKSKFCTYTPLHIHLNAFLVIVSYLAQ